MAHSKFERQVRSNLLGLRVRAIDKNGSLAKAGVRFRMDTAWRKRNYYFAAHKALRIRVQLHDEQSGGWVALTKRLNPNQGFHPGFVKGWWKK